MKRLNRVGGWFNLRGSNIVVLENLKYIGGDMYGEFISCLANLPSLVTVKGDLLLSNTDIRNLPKLEEVGGRLSLEHSNFINAEELASIGSSLDLRGLALEGLSNFRSLFPKLKSIGQDQTGVSIHVSNIELKHNIEFIPHRELNVSGKIKLG